MASSLAIVRGLNIVQTIKQISGLPAAFAEVGNQLPLVESGGKAQQNNAIGDYNTFQSGEYVGTNPYFGKEPPKRPSVDEHQ